VSDLAEYLGLSERCIRDRLKELPDLYKNDRGVVIRIDNTRKS